MNLSPFTVLRGDTFVLPADAASAATTKLVSDNGFITVDQGTLVVSVPVEDSFFRVGQGTLELGNSVGANVSVSVFGSEDPRNIGSPRPPGGPDSVLKLDQPAAFQGVITPYFGSTINLVGVTADSVTFAPSTRAGASYRELSLQLLDDGATVASLDVYGITGDPYGAVFMGFSLAPDGAGGTLIRLDFEPNRFYPGGLKVPGPYSQYSVDLTAGVMVVSGAGLTEYLNPGTALVFTDGVLSFSARAPGSDLYRFYDAALGRAPDAEGNLYWSGLLRRYGEKAIADGFLQSPEYQGRQGTEPTDAEFVGRLYREALGRAPDAAGESYWVDHLGSDQSRADVLGNFATRAFEAVQHSAVGIAATGVFAPDSSFLR